MKYKDAKLFLLNYIFLSGWKRIFVSKKLLVMAIKTVLEFPAVVPEKVITAADINQDI